MTMTSKTMSGAGIFFVSKRIEVRIKTITFSSPNPLSLKRTTPADAINPAATTVIPLIATLMPLMVFS